MNAVLTLPQGLETIGLGSLLAFPGIPSERSAKQLSASTRELARSISAVLNEFLVRAVEKRTPAAFIALREQVFPAYLSTQRTLSELARITVPRHLMEQLAAESFCEMEAEIREQGLLAFGTEVRDQAMFTVWTLRKINDLCDKLVDSPPPESLKQKDQEISNEFGLYLVWARFHLDCLFKSMNTQRAVHPGVLDVIMDGLRSVVNAYALARRGLDLRIPPAEAEIFTADWDEEDQSLLDEATRGFSGEPF